MPKPKPSCLFPPCLLSNFAKGYCSAHYMQVRRGVPLREVRPSRPTPEEGYAYCSTCKQFLDEEYFSPDRVRGGLARACRPCRAEAMRAYNKNNRKRISRNVTLSKWGITNEQYEALTAAQDGKCAICKRTPTTKSLCLDHDHATGAVRGLCCQDCNLGMGQLKDDPKLLDRAAAYLRAGGVLKGELAFSIDVEKFGARRTEIRRRARLASPTAR